jgi:hypothetical protein
VRPFHAHPLRKLTHLAIAQYKLLLQVSALELLASFS